MYCITPGAVFVVDYLFKGISLCCCELGVVLEFYPTECSTLKEELSLTISRFVHRNLCNFFYQGRVRDTNPKCILKTNVVNTREEPTVLVKLGELGHMPLGPLFLV